MTSPVANVTNVPLPIDAEAINLSINLTINPATSLRIWSVTYDQNKNCYDLE